MRATNSQFPPRLDLAQAFCRCSFDTSKSLRVCCRIRCMKTFGLRVVEVWQPWNAVRPENALEHVTSTFTGTQGPSYSELIHQEPECRQFSATESLTQSDRAGSRTFSAPNLESCLDPGPPCDDPIVVLSDPCVHHFPINIQVAPTPTPGSLSKSRAYARLRMKL